MWLPIVDVSEHQGNINFETMRSQGVHGVILRICHGRTLDARFWNNWEWANLYFPGQVGVYPFINPKRGGAAETAVWMVNQLGSVKVPFVMLDVESYQNESPNKGVIWPAAQNAEWLNIHVATLRRLLPDTVLIGYSNASYWNTWVGDEQLAEQLEWLVPRYPIYSPGGYAASPVPGTSGWPTWAFSKAPLGPFPPRGAGGWEGWQFSAGYNQQGPRYGCQSQDLDLNIVDSDAWNRWTSQTVPPPPPPDEEDMKPIIYTVRSEIDPANSYAWFKVNPDDTVRQVRNGNERDLYLAEGALVREPESTPHFREILTTLQPIGALGTQGKAVLDEDGGDAVADWEARAYRNTITVTVPPIEIPDLSFSGIIVS